MPEPDVPATDDAIARMDNLSSSESESEEPVEMLVTGRAKRSTAGNRMSAMIGEVAADDELELLFAEDEEAGPDEEFEEEAEEGLSDNDLGDSSDDEDQGPTGAADDLEGEKEIEKQAKDDRKRKRKAQRAFTKPSKKMKHAPFMGSAAPAVPASKAKKKIERLSWVPDVGAGTRTSKRETTTQQSEALRTRIVAREKDRKEQMKRLEEKARRREANKPKALTQEDRLKEAAEVEKENMKSLNRWEAIERERQEEQRKRLEALQNRKLQGPVITYWSGPARWVGDKLVAVGSEKVKKALEKPEAKEPEPADVDMVDDITKDDGDPGVQTDSGANPSDHQRPRTSEGSVPKPDRLRRSSDLGQSQRPSSRSMPVRPKSSGSISTSSQPIKPFAPREGLAKSTIETQLKSSGESKGKSTSPHPSVLPSIREPTLLGAHDTSPQPSSNAEPTPGAQSASPQPSSQPPSTKDQHSPMPQLQNSDLKPDQTQRLQSESAHGRPSEGGSSTSPAPTAQEGELYRASFIKQEPSASGTATPTSTARYDGPQQIVFSIHTPQPTTDNASRASSTPHPPLIQVVSSSDAGQSGKPASRPPGPPPEPMIAARNLISLANVDLSSLTSSTIPKELQGSLLVASSKAVKQKKAAKPPPPPSCPVTGMQIKYKDPHTGLGYANSYAYKQLKSVRNGRLMWNEVTGTYAGPAPKAADGVPEEFLKAMNATQARA